MCDGDSESKILSFQKGKIIRRDDSVCVLDSSQSKENSGSLICDVFVVISSIKYFNNIIELGIKFLIEDFIGKEFV